MYSPKCPVIFCSYIRLKKNTLHENQFKRFFIFLNGNSKWLVLGGLIFASHQSPNSSFIFRNRLLLISLLCFSPLFLFSVFEKREYGEWPLCRPGVWVGELNVLPTAWPCWSRSVWRVCWSPWGPWWASPEERIRKLAGAHQALWDANKSHGDGPYFASKTCLGLSL